MDKKIEKISGSQGEKHRWVPRHFLWRTLFALAVSVFALAISGYWRYAAGLLFPKYQLSDVQENNPVAHYVSIPGLLINLHSPAGRQHFLRLSLVLELRSVTDADRVKEILPRIISQFQIYLRQLRMSDLKGSEGIFRLKEQLLSRAKAGAEPTKIQDLLFKNMLVQ